MAVKLSLLVMFPKKKIIGGRRKGSNFILKKKKPSQFYWHVLRNRCMNH